MMKSNSIMKLSEKCRFMNICGVDIVGCPDTGVIIGLDQEGTTLVRRLKEGITPQMADISDNQMFLLDELSSNGFCSNQPVPNKVRRSYFHVTSHCNLHCEGCYSYENNRNSTKDLCIAQLHPIHTIH